MDFRLDLLAVQGTLKSLLQHHSSKASMLRCSAFFIVQLWHPYMTTRKTIALTRWTFVGKVMSLLFNMLSRLVITFLPRSKRLLVSWQQSPSAVPLEAKKESLSLFSLFWEVFISPSHLKDNFAGQSIFSWQLLSFNILIMLFHSPLVCRFAAEKYSDAIRAKGLKGALL